jgi:hypothetical protein
MRRDFAAWSERPPSELEWEDLLVRFEIAPRALRVAVEDAPKTGEGAQEVASALLLLVCAETWLVHALDGLRRGSVPGNAAPMEGVSDLTHDGLVARFASLRTKSFAMVQRRGIDVWEWRADGPDGVALTPYRVINAEVMLDGETLAALRAAAREARPC